jgi:large subunit ribosomal protein L5
MKARLYEKYKNEVVPALKQKHNYTNVHQIPKLEKIVVNMGISASLEKNAIEDAAKDLSLLTGRKPVISKSRHSIANFKLRENMPIGCRVTLRRDVMYEFFDRLVAAALPRIRDFRGLSPRKFDGRGNYTFGVAEQTIFPEIELDKIKRTQGMDITIVTSAQDDATALELLKMMGFPFAEAKEAPVKTPEALKAEAEAKAGAKAAAEARAALEAQADAEHKAAAEAKPEVKAETK